MKRYTLRSLYKDLKYLTKRKSRFGEESEKPVENELSTALEKLKKDGLVHSVFFRRTGMTSSGTCLINLKNLKEDTNNYLSIFNNALNNFKFGSLLDVFVNLAGDKIAERGLPECRNLYQTTRAELLNSLMDLDKRISILEKKEPTLKDFITSEQVQEKYSAFLNKNNKLKVGGGLAALALGSSVSDVATTGEVAQPELNRIVLLSYIITEILLNFGKRILAIKF